MATKADLIAPLDVREPPGHATGKVGELWKPVEGTNKIVCTACARYCKIGEGQVGLCGVRGVHDGKLWLYAYGRVITGHVDPIEKKPVMHYRPGSKIFSVATTGCNWLCHPAGTPILLADGTTKPVEDVSAGDALWSVADLGGRTVPDIVTEAGFRKAAVHRVSVEGLSAPLLGTTEHPVLTRNGWKRIADLATTDSVMIRTKLVPWQGLTESVQVPTHGQRIHPHETSEFLRRMADQDASSPAFRWSRVLGVSRESGRETVYSFECVPFHNYVANDVLVHNCRYCFLPDTKVLTDVGHETMASIFAGSTPGENPEVRTVEGKQAFTHRGRWRRVSKSFEHLYSGTILHIRPYYLPGFECTPEHGILASVGGGPVRKAEAQGLKIGDFLAIPRAKAEATRPINVEEILRAQIPPRYKRGAYLDVQDGRVRWSWERNQGIPAKLPVTSNLARLLGYYCAEGSVSWHRHRTNSGSTWFSFGAHEEALISDVESTIRSVFGLKTRRSRQENRTAVIVSSASLATVFRATCGDSSGTKRVPREILQSTEPSVLRGFLSGYFRGDGYVTKRDGGLVLGSSSVSAMLTYGVAQLLLNLGDIPRVYRAKNAPENEIEGRIVNRSDDYMVRLLVDAVDLHSEEAQWKASKVRVIETEEYFLVPIRTIEERQYVGPVYNIEVEEDHSYTANLVAVANCQNFDISQRRKVEGIEVEPEDVVKMTLEQGCQGLAYTYNQPTIFMEFDRDIGMAARKSGLMNIFVSNGDDTPEAVAEMPKFLDCIPVDFKGSGETKFVQRYIGIPNADPIFDTIQRIRDTKATHIEITDLIVPQVGDDLEAAKKLSKFVYDELGPDTPIHFLRFHPDYKMNEFPWTPVETLEKHCEVATAAGLKYVYIGNVGEHKLEHTYCPACGAITILPDHYAYTA